MDAYTCCSIGYDTYWNNRQHTELFNKGSGMENCHVFLNSER